MHFTRDLLLKRLVVADRMLASRAGCCLHQLAAELNICERTARRVVRFIDKGWAWSGDLAVERTALRRWRYRTRGASIFVRPPRRQPT